MAKSFFAGVLLVLIAALALVALPSAAQAVTRLQFLPGNQNAMAIITATAPNGVGDDDWMLLMNMMNVPLQTSPFGPGKSIVTQKRDFNLVCGQERKQCQVILNRSPRVTIDSTQKTMSFQVTGPEALEFRRLFYPENSQEVEFVSIDEKFIIHASDDEFLFTAQEK